MARRGMGPQKQSQAENPKKPTNQQRKLQAASKDGSEVGSLNPKNWSSTRGQTSSLTQVLGPSA